MANEDELCKRLFVNAGDAFVTQDVSISDNMC